MTKQKPFIIDRSTEADLIDRSTEADLDELRDPPAGRVLLAVVIGEVIIAISLVVIYVGWLR